MARKKERDDDFRGDAAAVDANGATAIATEAPKAPETQEVNGEGTEGKRKKRRDPNAVRPIYLLLAIRRDTKTLRILFDAPTIGRARKQLATAVYGLRDNEDGPVIARCKMVS